MTLPSWAFQEHNHHNCLTQAITTAKRLCDDKGLKLTPIREEVLTIVWQSHKPLGAYAILEQLKGPHRKRSPAPPTVYRALDFLQDNGFVHRIASLNAYIGCCTPSQAHHGHFLICRACSMTVEITTDTVHSAIQQATQSAGFYVEAECVEVIGLCPACIRENSTGDTSRKNLSGEKA